MAQRPRPLTRFLVTTIALGRLSPEGPNRSPWALELPAVACRRTSCGDTLLGRPLRSRVWAASALDVVRNLSTEVILLKSDNEEEVERVLPRTMTELTEAA